jgi:hypothetical protein
MQWHKAVGVVALATLGGGLIPAQATDNVTGEHWHNRPISCKISARFPPDWVTAIQDSASAWTSSTTLDFQTCSLATDPTDTTGFANKSVHTIDFFLPEWALWCDPLTTIACARLVHKPFPEQNHLADADIGYNEIYFAESGTVAATHCQTSLPDPIYGPSVIMHELGHWGYLGHSTDEDSMMFSTYNYCKPALRTHDITSANLKYSGHGM